jgi:hypothetical protein
MGELNWAIDQPYANLDCTRATLHERKQANLIERPGCLCHLP